MIFRNFICQLKKFKTSSILNILGLSSAFTVFIITMLQVNHNFTYNRGFEKHKEIYVLSNNDTAFGERFRGNRKNFIEQATERFSEIKNYCTTSNINIERSFYTEQKKDEIYIIPCLHVSSGFFEMFTPEIIDGNYDKTRSTASYPTAMITQSLSQKIFGGENPIGKNIYIAEEDIPITVTIVCKDFQKNSSIKSEIFILNNDEKIRFFTLFLEIDPKNATMLQEKFNTDEIISEVKYEGTVIELFPFTDFHNYFPGEFTDVGNKNETLALFSIGIIIIIIAYINFINFSISMTPVRVKTINIQKILGAKLNSLRIQIAFEPVIFSIVSLLISFLLFMILKKNISNDIFTVNMLILDNLGFIITILAVVLFLSLFLGLYPARYITSFKPANALNGKFSFSQKSIWLRNLLIILQFIASITIVIIAVFMKLQYNYITDYSWGIQKENIVCLPNNLNTGIDIFGSELRNHPEIIDYTASQTLPGHIASSVGTTLENGSDAGLVWWVVKNNFLNFFGMEMISGDNFTQETNDKYEIIFNENFLKKYDLNENDLIETVWRGNFSLAAPNEILGYNIKGIIKDINFESLKNPIRPLLFSYGPGDKYNWIFVKISGHNISETLNYIEDTWKRFSNDKFELSFLDETLDALYKKEMSLSKTIVVFAIIAVIIAIMGVYGLIIFNSKYKEKEIAIRKVNGASVKQILTMLNRNVFYQLIMAFIISIPIAYFIIKKWLENFEYKIPVYWWVFLLGGFIVFIVTIITINGQSYRAATKNPTESLNKE